ncbi:MAG: YkgJ family cysteine cluster protein [Methylococcales bacterium]|jgi:uncharacterized protein|nr:YkgJ family cysteine cluster protein [Methylococcales bacterium]MBT7410886.1 YkgJ family cysteine cluster protein [Methylococcales bacterium]
MSEANKTEITAQNKCEFCINSKCCTYVTQKIDTPRSKLDFEHLLWQVSHLNVEIYQDSDGWFILFQSKCAHLLADRKCAVYDRRPYICEDYSNDYCEYDSPAEESFKLHFKTYDELRTYCLKRFKRWVK